MDLADAVAELYGVLPEEFIATRTELQRRARADGDRALAAEIGGLGKPSAAAWLSNQLVRARPEEIHGLLELGDLLREAQQNLAGDELRRLDVQRRRLIAALGRQARALAAELGHPVSATVTTQLEETLRAALADPDAADAVRSGRLTGPLSYSGLGTAPRPSLRVVPPPEPAAAAHPSAARKAGAGKHAAGARKHAAGARTSAAEDRRRAEEARAEEERRRAERERRRRELAEARAAADAASAAAEEAVAAEEEARSAVAALRDREATVARRIEELTAELAGLREERDTVGTELTGARRRRQAAARRTADATAARERARTRVAALEEDGF